jgi:hypothetical protein
VASTAAATSLPLDARRKKQQPEGQRKEKKEKLPETPSQDCHSKTAKYERRNKSFPRLLRLLLLSLLFCLPACLPAYLPFRFAMRFP